MMAKGWVYSIKHRKDENNQPYADMRIIFDGGSTISKEYKDLDKVEVIKRDGIPRNEDKV